MVKGFKEHIDSSLHPAFEKEVERHADEVYQGVHPDLPHYGRYHYQTAVDHVADRIAEKFHHHFKSSLNKYGGSDHFSRIAHKVVSKYSDDDTKESNRRERAETKIAARNAKTIRKEPKPPKPPVVKARRGIGSY